MCFGSGTLSLFRRTCRTTTQRQSHPAADRSVNRVVRSDSRRGATECAAAGLSAAGDRSTEQRRRRDRQPMAKPQSCLKAPRGINSSSKDTRRRERMSMMPGDHAFVVRRRWPDRRTEPHSVQTSTGEEAQEIRRKVRRTKVDPTKRRECRIVESVGE